MGSYSDCSSDPDEELPVFDFLQPARHLSQASQRQAEKPHLVDLDDSDASAAAVSSPGRGSRGVCTGTADVTIISSSSDDDDEPYVPLAQRIKQKRDNVISASSVATNGNGAEHFLPSGLASSQLSCQNGFLESECLLGSYQVRKMGREQDLEELPLKRARSIDTSPAKRRPGKRVVEEIQASGEEALRRRQARERQQRDKDVLREERERQKTERKALAEAAKALRPEECIKHMVVVVDPALLQLEGGGTLLASVQALGCSCAIEKQPLPRSVSWMRRAPCVQPDEGASVPEAYVVMQMTVEDFITLIHSYIQVRLWTHADILGPGAAKAPPWPDPQPGSDGAGEILQKSQHQKNFREAVTKTGGGKAKKREKNGGAAVLPEVSRVEVEEALVHLQLHAGVSVRFFSTWRDFSNHIAMTTKAVAEAPFKREREKTGFSFHLESEWAGGQRVDRAGKGLLQVWKRQIQQFNRVSPDMAAAILAAYPSPQLLEQAYSLCRTEQEKLSLLSDLLIRRGEGVTSTSRRVGPELSKRIFLTMSSCDPEQTVDSSL
ncbi:crossover junction endonuclease EME1 isoform X2 [Archocentrus centrarchus]|uniref:crossover junction endonuclease EME1 isoform X2 n=1 Tax=Archocentrus centrarchus TaxID=63155 RepID=UPI0011EA3D83|nr:crossover junction endonuclease EME1 isoform X2 [Archocentrus centrarchus]